MTKVRAKKHLGQHFLNDPNIASNIVAALTADGYNQLVEIGPGMGVLTTMLIEKQSFVLKAIDVDRESVAYLKSNLPEHAHSFIEGDFLKLNLNELFNKGEFAVIGNFPYNISSQILFKVLDNAALIPEVVGMFQREVAQRIAAPPGNKTYGAISVLLQARYDIEYLFTVPEHVFTPPPKVKSAVIRMKRKPPPEMTCSEQFFKTIVKTAFNQRRKTLRNSLKPYLGNAEVSPELLQLRPEQLSYQTFADLASCLSATHDRS
jgi:16S rRNA (adenine1518-N6/adenine1519-N6)-dimethyltransferase